MRLPARGLVLALLLTLAGCASLPRDVARTPSRALDDTAQTRLGRSHGAAAAAHPGLTGVHPLADGREAFAARLLLARAAERTIDAQYYIWHGDVSGGLLAHALREAADRGVRVRLLLDDADTAGEDDLIATLDAHPNVEVRLFNPFPDRSARIADYATDFKRLNRRMHNKCFVADNQLAVVGGRNVGDEYFDAPAEVEFTDLDVAVAGAVVREVSAEFDAYWNSASAYPAASIVAPASEATVARVRAHWDALHQGEQARRYLDAVRERPLVAQMVEGTMTMEWVPGRVVHDDPAKVLQPPDHVELQMLPRLEAALGRPAAELDLVSPYFVPTRAGTAALVAVAARGVKVRVLTNSLEATDVGPVYAGYSKYRAELLRGGVRLYELKRVQDRPDDKRPHAQLGGSRVASLHAKTFGVDRARVFVGSFNLDPRSAQLNTEMGVVLESPALAARLSDVFDATIPRIAYELRLATDGAGVAWAERTETGEVLHTSTPGVGALRQLWIDLLSILPIEWLL